ncbi:hypothetical protein MAR_001637, partial [Mya arenaria]
MALWQDWNSKKVPDSRFSDPLPAPGSRAFLDVSISLMSQLLYGGTGSVRKYPTAASPTPTPPGSRAFLEYSILLMSHWLYGRTGPV